MDRIKEIILGIIFIHVITCVILCVFFAFLDTTAITFSKVMASLTLCLMFGWIYTGPCAFIVMIIASFFPRPSIAAVIAILFVVIVECSIISFIFDPAQYMSQHMSQFPTTQQAEARKFYIQEASWFFSDFNRMAIIAGGVASLLTFFLFRLPMARNFK